MTQPQPAGWGGEAPVPAYGVGAAPPPPKTWRGLAMSSRVRFATGVATLAAAIGAFYALMGLVWSLGLRSSATIPSESTLRLFTWQYELTSGGVVSGARWMTPPLLVVGLLVAAMALLDHVSRGKVFPLRKAQGKAVAFRTPPEARRQIEAELRTAGYSSLSGPGGRVSLLVGGLLAGLAGLLSLLLPLQDGFTRGYGPVVCGVAGIVALLSMLVATPWQRWPEVVVMADGRITVAGVEPLAQVVPFPGPAAVGPSTVAPPPPPPPPPWSGQRPPAPPPPVAKVG